MSKKKKFHTFTPAQIAWRVMEAVAGRLIPTDWETRDEYTKQTGKKLPRVENYWGRHWADVAGSKIPGDRQAYLDHLRRMEGR